MMAKNQSLKLFLLYGLIKIYSALRCMDENNNPVDWYYMYKFPQIKHQPKLIKSGLAYMYMTSNVSNEWQLSKISILNTQSMLGLTLQPLLSGQQNAYHILYNDQPPNKKSNLKKGHTKGIVLLDKNEGIWLIHSVPHFPNISEHYYPISGIVYGQSFLCVSLNLNNLDKVGIQLKYNQPQIYSTNIPSNLKETLPNLYDAATGSTIQQSPWYNLLNLTTISGITFTSFAKSRQFGKELYADFIAPYLNTNLFVSSWMHGKNIIPSDCTKSYKINNVKSVNVTDYYLNFNTTEDHSKWAVSDNQSTWTCVGDINRQLTQEKRGGGSLCLSDSNIANAYRHIIQEYDNCINFLDDCPKNVMPFGNGSKNKNKRN